VANSIKQKIIARAKLIRQVFNRVARQIIGAYPRLQQGCQNYKHAFETTAADRDRLQDELNELSNYGHAFETTAADRDRLHNELNELNTKYHDLRSELYTYKDAFETTAIDRDRLLVNSKGESDKGIQLRAGLLAYALLREVNIHPSDLAGSLRRAWPKWSSKPCPTDQEDICNTASDGLILAAETILSDANLSKIALEFVGVALKITSKFYCDKFSVELYLLNCKSRVEHIGYLEAAVAAGEWPDAGTKSAQKAAIERNMPSILLTTLPKSGSVYLWTVIAKSLELPTFKIARIGESATEEEIVPGLLRCFVEGGLCSQHHLAPSDHNIENLKKYGVKRLILHFRDPRQAAVSMWHYSIRIGASRPRDRSQDEIEEHLWKTYLVPAAKWLNGWLEVVDKESSIEVFLSTHEKMISRSETKVIKEMLDFYGIPETDYDLKIPQKSDATHFRKGATDEWLEFFSEDFKKRSLELIPNSIARRFGWIEI